MKEQMKITLSHAVGDIFVPFEGFFFCLERQIKKKKSYKTFALVFEVRAVSWERGGSGSLVSLLDFREEQLNSGVWDYLSSTPARLFLGGCHSSFHCVLVAFKFEVRI